MAFREYVGTPSCIHMKTTTSITRRDFFAATTLTLAGVLGPLKTLSATASPYQIGCYTRPWDQFEYRVALDGIAEAGFHYAGLMTAKGKSWVLITVDSTSEEVTKVSDEVKKRGLKTLSIYGGDIPVAKSVEAGIAGLKKLVDHCELGGC